MKNKKKRIFIIEPNVLSNLGHSLEFIKGCQNWLKEKDYQVIVVTNKKFSLILKGEVCRGLTNRCFENLQSEGKDFFSDLEKLNSIYKFDSSDKILIPTAYTNEILGSNRFLKIHNLPPFYLIIHQMFPPTENFKISHNFINKRQTIARILKTFSTLDERLEIFTTDSEPFNRLINRQKHISVKMVHFPFEPTEIRESKSKYDFSFLGDNRYEKSLNIITSYLKYSPERSAFIQLNPPRGFPGKDMLELEDDLEVLKNRKNISLFEGPLGLEDFQTALMGSKFMLLPYNKKSYDKRVSGILLESLFAKKPVIVTDGTWMAQITEKYNVGVVLKLKNNKSNNKIIDKAIERIENNYSFYLANINKALPNLRKTYSFDHFFKEINVR